MSISFFQKSISRRINTGFALVVGLLLGCAFAGYYGLNQTGKTLSFLSGPAWDNADGTMNGVIELQSQTIALQRLFDGIDSEACKKQIESTRSAVKESFARVREAGVTTPEDLAKIDALIASSDKTLVELINARTAGIENSHYFETEEAKVIQAQQTIQTYLANIVAASPAEVIGINAISNTQDLKLAQLLFRLANTVSELRAASQIDVLECNDATLREVDALINTAGVQSREFLTFCNQQKGIDAKYNDFEKYAKTWTDSIDNISSRARRFTE